MWKGDKRGQSCANRQLVSMLVWPVHLSGHALHLISTVCPVSWLNTVSNSSPGRGTPFSIHEYVGSDCSSWNGSRVRGDMWQERPEHVCIVYVYVSVCSQSNAKPVQLASRIRGFGAQYWGVCRFGPHPGGTQGSVSQLLEGPKDMGNNWDTCLCVRMCVWVCASVCKGVCTSGTWTGATATGFCTPRCQCLGRLGSRGSCWADWQSKPSCWRDPHYISHSQTFILNHQRAGQG